MSEEQSIPLLRQPKESYGSEYEKHLFEQYKLYVEMTDRVSGRRMLANSFFVGVHTALVVAFTALLKEKVLPATIIGLIPFAAVLLLCFVWWRIVYSYRQLNSGKFKVVHAFEQLLPSAPYDAEWVVLGRGKKPELYRPLTHVETWVPVCFALLYAFLVYALYCQFCK